MGRLPKCYKGKRHHFEFIFPMNGKGDVTMACSWCGIVQQFPMKAPPPVLDEMSAEEIERRVFGYAR